MSGILQPALDALDRRQRVIDELAANAGAKCAGDADLRPWYESGLIEPQSFIRVVRF